HRLFFSTPPPTPSSSTLSLHAALPILVERRVESDRLALRPPSLHVLTEPLHLGFRDIAGDLQLLDLQVHLEIAHHAEEVPPHLRLLRGEARIGAAHLGDVA